MDLYSLDMSISETAIIDRLRWFEMLPNRPNDQRLDFSSRDPANRTGALGRALKKGGGQIIAVLDAAFARVARGRPSSPLL